MVLYNYGHFNFGEVSSNNVMIPSPYNTPSPGTEYVNRTKHDYEILLKGGWTFNFGRLLLDLYLGLGLRFKYLNDTVFLWLTEADEPPQHDGPGYPYNR